MFRLFIILNLAISCLACSNTVQETSDHRLVISKELAKGCSTSPPIHDIGKIKVMLKNAGRITDNMTEQEKNTLVNEFIKSKNRANKECK